MVCTFFGHRDCTELEKSRISAAIENVIAEGVDEFLVGNQGAFDRMVYGCLQQLKQKYPQISTAVVLAYFPREVNRQMGYENTIFPEGMETVSPKYAIDGRNRWMLGQADCVICYVRHAWGGAYKFAAEAAKAGKEVRNLCIGGVAF